MKLIFATNNLHKIEEVQQLLPSSVEVITLKQAGITEEIEEPFDTFRENAMAKASYIRTKTGMNCFAEDSGLCVPALDGAPGVFSARYAGIPSNDKENNKLLLHRMQDIGDRYAYYVSTIGLIWDGQAYYFEGKCEGSIADQEYGTGGFGYDPLFIPSGHNETFGTLPPDVKLEISHRKQSVFLMVEKLNRLLYP